MESVIYYNYPTDDFRDDTVPLRVNSTGYIALRQPFVTQRTRRDWYLQLIDTGALCSIRGGTEDFSAGQFVIYPPDTPHYYELRTEGEIGYYFLHFTGSGIAALLKKCALAPARIYTLPEEALPSLRHAISSLFRECMLRRPCYEEMAASMAAELFVRLGRANLPKAEYDNDARRRLEEAFAYLHRHYTEPIRIGQLSEISHLSESRFRELFRQAYQCAPHEYQQNLRLGHAAELLTSTDYTVTEIARLCGYPDVLYFIRLFKKKQGIAPGAFRRTLAR